MRSIEENWIFSFVSSYHLEIASGLGIVSAFTSQSWNSIWLGPVHAATFLWVHMCVSPCVWKILFPCCCLSPLTLVIFVPPFLHSSLSSEGRQAQLGLRIPEPCCLHFVQLWFSVVSPIYCRKKLLWRWLGRALIYGIGRMSLGVILSLYSFSITIVFGFLTGLWSI